MIFIKFFPSKTSQTVINNFFNSLTDCQKKKELNEIKLLVWFLVDQSMVIVIDVRRKNQDFSEDFDVSV